VTNSDWNIWAALFNGVTSQFWHNGVSEAGPGDAGAQVFGGSNYVGKHTGVAQYWKGDVVELLYYHANLSDADKNQVIEYLGRRYNLVTVSI